MDVLKQNMKAVENTRKVCGKSHVDFTKSYTEVMTARSSQETNRGQRVINNLPEMEGGSTEEKVNKLLVEGLGLVGYGVQSATRVGEQKAEGKYARIVIATLEDSSKISTVLSEKKNAAKL